MYSLKTVEIPWSKVNKMELPWERLSLLNSYNIELKDIYKEHITMQINT